MNNMLVNCPRCGFSQPQDRYCANCGVDMDNYKPKPTNPVKKILSSPVLHIFIIALIVMASVIAIKQRQKEELQARIEFLKSGPVMVERQNPAQIQETQVSISPEAQADLAEQPPAASEAPTLPGQQPADVNSASVAAMSAAPTSSTTVPDRSGGGGTARTNSPLKMVVSYVEVDRRLLNSWLEEAKATGQQRVFENVKMGPLLQVASKLKPSQSLRVLQTIERSLDPNNPTQEWFVGTHQGNDPDQQMGFFSSLALVEIRDGLIRGDIEVQRSFRNPKDATRVLERVSFGSPFEIGAGSGYILSGLLPVQYATALPEESNPDPFLQVFKSQSFLSFQTEFTLVIQFVTPAATTAPRQ
jgi:hypothetical protein